MSEEPNTNHFIVLWFIPEKLLVSDREQNSPLVSKKKKLFLSPQKRKEIYKNQDTLDSMESVKTDFVSAQKNLLLLCR